MNDFLLKEDKRFDEMCNKSFLKGGLTSLTDYPPHAWELDPIAVKKFLRASHLRLLARLREEVKKYKCGEHKKLLALLAEPE